MSTLTKTAILATAIVAVILGATNSEASPLLESGRDASIHDMLIETASHTSWHKFIICGCLSTLLAICTLLLLNFYFKWTDSVQTA